MKLDKQNSTLKTFVGSLLTILAYIVVIGYTYLKVDVWVGKKDVDIMSTKMIDHFANDYIVSHSNMGLYLAVAFTDFDTNTEPILDKSYGRLVFNAYEWGTDEKGEYFLR